MTLRHPDDSLHVSNIDFLVEVAGKFLQNLPAASLQSYVRFARVVVLCVKSKQGLSSRFVTAQTECSNQQLLLITIICSAHSENK